MFHINSVLFIFIFTYVYICIYMRRLCVFVSNYVTVMWYRECLQNAARGNPIDNTNSESSVFPSASTSPLSVASPNIFPSSSSTTLTTTPIIVCLDVGVLSSQVIGCKSIHTNTSPQGLTIDEALDIMFLCGLDPNVILVDISEFCPDAEDSRCNMLVAELFYKFILGVTLRKKNHNDKNNNSSSSNSSSSSSSSSNSSSSSRSSSSSSSSSSSNATAAVTTKDVVISKSSNRSSSTIIGNSNNARSNEKSRLPSYSIDNYYNMDGESFNPSSSSSLTSLSSIPSLSSSLTSSLSIPSSVNQSKYITINPSINHSFHSSNYLPLKSSSSIQQQQQQQQQLSGQQQQQSIGGCLYHQPPMDIQTNNIGALSYVNDSINRILPSQSSSTSVQSSHAQHHYYYHMQQQQHQMQEIHQQQQQLVPPPHPYHLPFTTTNNNTSNSTEGTYNVLIFDLVSLL